MKNLHLLKLTILFGALCIPGCNNNEQTRYDSGGRPISSEMIKEKINDVISNYAYQNHEFYGVSMGRPPPLGRLSSDTTLINKASYQQLIIGDIGI